jgi:protoheme IX farnesyltransferase
VALIGYAVIYTAYLKHATPQNIVIGGAAGAAPPVLGWAAITGDVHHDALLLFLIIFAWTPPHFWALAIAKREDYAKAGIPMLPVTHGVRHTTLQILLYSVLMVVVTILPFLTGMGGLLYLAGALILGGVFIAKAWALQKTPCYDLAMGLFGYSITYLMALFAIMLVDHYVMPGGQVLS